MSDAKGFWSSLPGILAGVATVITAVTGLYIAVANNDSSEGITGVGTGGDDVIGSGGDTNSGPGGLLLASSSNDDGVNTSIAATESSEPITAVIDDGSNDVSAVQSINSSTLLDCSKFPTKNSIASLMSWSGHYHDKLLKEESSNIGDTCNKVISYRGMAHCQDPNDVAIHYALQSSLALCEKRGFSWKDVKI